MKFLASSLVIALFSSPVLADKNKLNFARKAKHNMKANDKVGRKLINKARKLENNQDYDNTFIAKYSIKFQGCHHVPQWNDGELLLSLDSHQNKFFIKDYIDYVHSLCRGK